jgi:hypothetical protein
MCPVYFVKDHTGLYPSATLSLRAREDKKLPLLQGEGWGEGNINGIIPLT